MSNFDSNEFADVRYEGNDISEIRFDGDVVWEALPWAGPNETGMMVNYDYYDDVADVGTEFNYDHADVPEMSLVQSAPPESESSTSMFIDNSSQGRYFGDEDWHETPRGYSYRTFYFASWWLNHHGYLYFLADRNNPMDDNVYISLYVDDIEAFVTDGGTEYSLGTRDPPGGEWGDMWWDTHVTLDEESGDDDIHLEMYVPGDYESDDDPILSESWSMAGMAPETGTIGFGWDIPETEFATTWRRPPAGGGDPAPTPPSAVTGLTATDITTNSIDIAWDAASGADHYNIYLNESLETSGWGGTSYAFTDLDDDTLYGLGVEAENNEGTSSLEEIWEQTDEITETWVDDYAWASSVTDYNEAFFSSPHSDWSIESSGYTGPQGYALEKADTGGTVSGLYTDDSSITYPSVGDTFVVHGRSDEGYTGSIHWFKFMWDADSNDNGIGVNYDLGFGSIYIGEEGNTTEHNLYSGAGAPSGGDIEITVEWISSDTIEVWLEHGGTSFGPWTESGISRTNNDGIIWAGTGNHPSNNTRFGGAELL